MCGIAGLAGAGNRDGGQQRVLRRIAALLPRGPDGNDGNIWPESRPGPGRLSIFDLSELGAQPMLSPNGSVGITFNGAIYNFRELRAELEAGGYQFKSHTDTEVMLHGYDAWGLDKLLERMRGMFAFALWDDRKQALFLVRDRLGVKPLLYATRKGQLAFASTARSLRAGGFAGEIDDLALAEYLEFGYVTDQRSIYRNVHKVAAASVVE